MKLKKALIIAIVLSIIGLVLWETFWRSQGYFPNIDGNEALWAVQRDKVNDLTDDDVVLVGSSRVLFDIQLNEWEKITGIRPIQLASGGASPLPVFHDIVNNTNFSGTVLVGVTPGIFFSKIDSTKNRWKRPLTQIKHFHDRTYAQRLNHQLSLPIQKSLAFINEDKRVDGIKLKVLLNKIKIGNRVIDSMPPFHDFSNFSVDRNVRMKERTVTDTAFANTIKKVWKSGGNDDPTLDKEATIAFFAKDAKKFTERGGNLIFLRCPSTGYYKKREATFISRTEYWEELLKQTKVKGYHYADYEQLKSLDCPEWSYLSANDADFFTKELLNIMIADEAIQPN